MDKYINKWINEFIRTVMVEWMDGWIERQMDEWIDERMVTNECTYIFNSIALLAELDIMIIWGDPLNCLERSSLIQSSQLGHTKN